MPRMDSIWVTAEPMDMRFHTDTVLERVVKVFGAATAKPHCVWYSTAWTAMTASGRPDVFC
jgi:hypothetical protein